MHPVNQPDQVLILLLVSRSCVVQELQQFGHGSESVAHGHDALNEDGIVAAEQEKHAQSVDHLSHVNDEEGVQGPVNDSVNRHECGGGSVPKHQWLE